MARLPNEIVVTNRVRIAGSELELSYARSGGPGGQHVNKTSTKAVLRWNALASPALSDDDKALLSKKLASKLTESGELVVTSEKSRDQATNAEDALEKLAEMVRQAIKRPKPRKKTKPSRRAKERRLKEKRQRSETKRMRRSPPRE